MENINTTIINTALEAPAFIRRELLAWYAKHQRALPFRKNPSPYTVWVSEVMAQQTRIAQLLPFFEAFIKRFPTVHALAAASLDEVLALWAGMGYYSRARHLHQAARVIVNERGGVWPDTPGEWKRLPGVGEYTAGAVMSIAFGERTAAVDGNALRVYARLANDDTDINAPVMKTRTASLITNAMPETPAEVSCFSQAFMELGALICVPRVPLCAACPLAEVCLARMMGRENLLPVKRPKKPPLAVQLTVLLVLDPSGRLLMRKRTERMLNGMWVPVLEPESDNPPDKTASRLIQSQMGYSIQKTEALGCAEHIFTHRRWQMNGYAVYVNETHGYEDYSFLSPEEVRSVAKPAATQFYLAWYLSR